MTILFAGNNITDFYSWNASYSGDTSSQYDSSWVSNSVRQSHRGYDPTKTPFFTSSNEVWVHFEVYFGNLDANYPFVYLYDSSGAGVLRAMQAGYAQYIYLQYYNGSSWVTFATGSTTGLITGTRYQMDLHAVRDGTNLTAACYINKEEWVSGTVAYAANQFAQMGFIGTDDGATCYFSQFIIADEPTLTFKYKQILPTGDSAVNTGWTGTYAAVDEAVLSDADYITSTAADEVRTFTSAARDFTGYAVKTMCLNYRGLCDTGGGPQNIQGCVRSGGTNYFTSTEALAAGFQNYKAYYPTNPATGVTWTPAEATATSLEFGIKSIA